MKPARLFGAFCAALFVWGCMLGGGSDTETITPTLTGEVVFITGAPAAGARVKLFDVNHDPSLPDAPAPRIAYADDSGRFAFEGLREAVLYNVIAANDGSTLWAFADSLEPEGMMRQMRLFLPLKVEVSLHPDTSYTQEEVGIAFFPGTDIIVHSNENFPASIDSVPKGVSHLVIRSITGWERTAYVLDDALDPDHVIRIQASEQGINIEPIVP